MGHFQIVLSTGQFLGEGVDIPNFHCLFLVYPFSFEGKLIQYIGRVHRSKQTPVIVDYWLITAFISVIIRSQALGGN